MYTLVSEYTCEENIVRRATQKKHLDKLILKDGAFLPEFFDKTAQGQEQFQNKLQKRFFSEEQQKIDLVYVNLINQEQLRQRLGDVLDAYQDDDDRTAGKMLLREYEGQDDADQIGSGDEKQDGRSDEGEFNESSKQIVDQLNIYQSLEKIPHVFMRHFESGFESVPTFQESDIQLSPTTGFSNKAFEQMAIQPSLEELSKQFIIHKVDNDFYFNQVKDLEHYASTELKTDVKVIESRPGGFRRSQKKKR